LGALGIFSAAEKPVFRHAARRSWLSGAAALEAAGGLACRFVIRGQNASAELLREVRSTADILLLDAQPLDRVRGPLVSLVLWLDCALHAWPSARLIGKADDDVFIRLAGVQRHLQLTFEAVRARSHSKPLLYWGVHETYNWDNDSSLPSGFSFLFGHNEEAEKKPCGRSGGRSGTRIGPFHFVRARHRRSALSLSLLSLS